MTGKEAPDSDLWPEHGWLTAECLHGTVRWVWVACRKPGCLLCAENSGEWARSSGEVCDCFHWANPCGP